MAVSVTHADAADGTFSTAGAAAWNAGHVMTGAANSVPFFGGAGNALIDSSSLTYDDSTKRLTVGTGSGTSSGWIAGYFGVSGNSGIWWSGDTPSTSNYRYRVDSGGTYVGGPNVRITANDVTKILQLGTAGEGPSITAGTAATNAQRALSISQTWTDGTSSNIGIVGNFDLGATGTATGKLLSLQAGAAGTTEVFAVDYLGAAALAAGTVSAPAITLAGDTATGWYRNADNQWTWSSNGTPYFSLVQSGTNMLRMASSVIANWSSTNNSTGSADTAISRVSAGVLGVGTGAPGSFSGSLKLTEAQLDYTNTAGGTTGNQTINKTSGSVNFAATATTLTVTNSFCTANSHVYCTVATNDGTATLKNVVPGAGSFVITLTAATTAETKVNFLVIN